MPIEGLAKVPRVGAWAEKQVVSLSGETRKRDLPQSYTTAAHLRIGTYVFFLSVVIVHFSSVIYCTYISAGSGRVFSGSGI